MTEKIEEEIVVEPVLTEIFEVPLQNRANAFWYGVKTKTEMFYLTVIAPSSTDASTVLKQQFPDAETHFLGMSTKIMQVS